LFTVSPTQPVQNRRRCKIADGAKSQTVPIRSIDQSNPLAQDTKYVNGSVVIFRNAPDSSATEIGALAFGTPVKLLSREGAWSKIEVGGYSGFVKSSFVADEISVSGDELYKELTAMLSAAPQDRVSPLISKYLGLKFMKPPTRKAMSKISGATVRSDAPMDFWGGGVRNILPDSHAEPYPDGSCEIFSHGSMDEDSTHLLFPWVGIFLWQWERLLFTELMHPNRYRFLLDFMRLGINPHYRKTPVSILETFPAFNPVFYGKPQEREDSRILAAQILAGFPGSNGEVSLVFDGKNYCGYSSPINLEALMKSIGSEKVHIRFDPAKSGRLIFEKPLYLLTLGTKPAQVKGWGKARIAYEGGFSVVPEKTGPGSPSQSEFDISWIESKEDALKLSKGVVILSPSAENYKTLLTARIVPTPEFVCSGQGGVGQDEVKKCRISMNLVFPDRKISGAYQILGELGGEVSSVVWSLELQQGAIRQKIKNQLDEGGTCP